jgi:hypothetical protein
MSFSDNVPKTGLKNKGVMRLKLVGVATAAHHIAGIFAGGGSK